ncbi:sulfotransferase [Micromonospora sp. CA-259024]|uniref:sulfotransferase n=1 Tax=Micromonospora sp. CA-259024 TaxID=3239965 RepID=UPI003D929B77
MPTGPEPPPVLFINGLHRSGTTLTAAAVTEATGGVTTTAGYLAQHIPSLADFLAAAPASGATRGVDRLAVTPDTAEEYGFLLRRFTGHNSLYADPAGVGVLRQAIRELGAPGTTVVLKNPFDLGHEKRLLTDFPQARILLIRRRLGDVQGSTRQALARILRTPSGYTQALGADGIRPGRLARILSPGPVGRLLRALINGWMYVRVLRLIRGVRGLPPDRIALVCYDELRADATAGAAWAAHLLDREALADAFTRRAFAQRGPAYSGSRLARWLDRRWERAWAAARDAQIRAGVLPVPPPAGASGGTGMISGGQRSAGPATPPESRVSGPAPER